MKIDLKKNTSEFWYLLLLIVGYVFFSGLAVPLNIENTRLFAVPYRFGVFIFAIFIIYKNFEWRKVKNISIISLIAFWILYAIKSVISFNNDAYLPEFVKVMDEVYVRLLVIASIPCIAAMMIDYRKLNLRLMVKYFYYIFISMLSFNLIYGLVTPHEGLGLNTIFTVYYISYGHLGTTLALISMYLLLFNKELLPKYLVWFGLLLGLATIVIATARSPFLALMIVSFYFVILKKNWKLYAAYFAAIILAIIGIYVYDQSGRTYFAFINRTYNWIFEGDNSLRTPLFERSLDIFKNNPLFGGRTLYEEGMYPHNIFLELLMATGIVGFVFYFIKFIPVFKTWRLYLSTKQNVYYLFFGALFLQYFVLVITSYNLFSVPEFLYFSSIIIGISLNYQNEEIESNDGRRNSSGNY